MNEIVKIKNEVMLKQWAEMVQCRNESGLTVSEWCRQNGINPKTYYYRLKRVRNAVYNEIEQHDIVPVLPKEEPEPSAEKIEIMVGDVKIALPDTFNPETLRRLLGVLK